MQRRKNFVRAALCGSVAGTVAALTAPFAHGQANMLGNPTFATSPLLAPNSDVPMENNLTGQPPIASWYSWNNETPPYAGYFDDNIPEPNSTNSIPAYTGPNTLDQVGKTYGGMTYSGNGPNAGIYQPVAATPGDSYTATGYFVNSSVNSGSDQLNNNETEDCRIFFDTGANGTGTQIGNPVISSTNVNENTPTDVWMQLNTMGVAPVGAQSIVWMAFYSCPVEFAAGAMYVDDTTLGYSALTWNNSGGTGDGATWDVNTNQNWTDGTNEALFPNGAPVTFNDNNNGHYAVNVPSTVQPWSTTFSATGNYTLSGAGGIGGTGSLTQSGTGTVTLSTVNTYSGGTFVTSGTLKIGVSGAIPVDSVVTISSSATMQLGTGTGVETLSSLSIAGTGTLDLTNNRILIDYGGGPDPIGSIASMIASGYAGGSWTGPGITSTAAQANSGSYGIGYADSADPGNPAGLASGQIEVMYTLLGDANLDGKVNGTDFTLMAANFNQAVTDGWDKGDFNYDGAVNGTDFTLLAKNFNQSASQSAVSSADLAALDAFAAANGISLTSVPEPASMLGMVVLAGASMMRRWRRNAPTVE